MTTPDPAPGEAAVTTPDPPNGRAAVTAPDPLAANVPLRRLTIAAVLLAALFLTCFQVTDTDLGGHVTVGREILKSHQIPSTNFFSHTHPDYPYPVHQWLGQVTLFLVHHFAGATGLILLRMLVVFLGAVLLFRNARREGAPIVVASAIVLVLLVCARPRFFERPFLVTIVFLPLLHGYVADLREGKTRRLWPIIPLMTIWAHVHSGVLFGALYLAASVVGEGAKILLARRPGRHAVPGSHVFPGTPLDGWNYRRLALFSAVAIALPIATVALINPSGVKPLALPFLFYQNQAFRQMILEYHSVRLSVDWPWDLVAGAALLGVLLRPRRVDLTQLLVSLGFGILAYQAVREIITFAAASAPLLGRTWGALADDLFARIGRGRRGQASSEGGGSARANVAEAIVAWAVVAAAAFVSFRATQDWMFPFGFGMDPKHFPERAVDFLWAENIQGPIFNTDVFSSCILLRGKGRRFPVFVDARLEAYPESFWRDEYYRVLEAAPGWEDVLRRYDVQCAILRRAGGEVDDRIGDVLWKDPGWGCVYWDDAMMIFVRRGGRAPRNDEVLRSWAFTAFSPRRPEDVRALRGAALDRAVAELTRLTGWEETSFLPRWALAAAWTRQGKGEDAADLFARLAALRDAKHNAAFVRSRAEAELVAGRRSRWAELLTEAKADPNTAASLFDGAALLAAAGKSDSSIAMYGEVLRADPSNADASNNLALLLGRAGRTKEGLQRVNEALRRSPNDAYYVATRAEILSLDGDRAGALAEFRKSLDLLPADDKAAREEVMHWILKLE
ncbi:MAG: tetratricopeptide repeat protein [bacterium]